MSLFLSYVVKEQRVCVCVLFEQKYRTEKENLEQIILLFYYVHNILSLYRTDIKK